MVNFSSEINYLIIIEKTSNLLGFINSSQIEIFLNQIFLECVKSNIENTFRSSS
jgi:hypothetical protein